MALVSKAWGAAEAWHCEGSAEAIGEGATSVAVGSPGLWGRSCREIEGLNPMKRVQESAAQLQQTPASWSFQYHGMTTKDSSRERSPPEPRGRALYTAEGGVRDDPSPLEESRRL